MNSIQLEQLIRARLHSLPLFFDLVCRSDRNRIEKKTKKKHTTKSTLNSAERMKTKCEIISEYMCRNDDSHFW